MMVQGFINKLLNKQGANVTLPVVQLADDGGMDYAKALEVENQTSPLTIGQRLFGRELTKDVQTTNPTTGETSMETIRSYRPGLFQDFQAGFRDNLNNGFNPDNLKADNSKGWATRIGEGLGTATRFLDSPLGRGLLVGGIVGASGGNGLQALAYGGGATVGNQANRMKDTAYRKYLNEMGIDTNNIRGYVDDTTFKQMIGAKQLQDNAEYRNMMLENQQKQNEILNALKQQQYLASQEQQKFNNQMALANLEDRRQTRNDNNYWKGKDYELKLKDAEDKAKGEDFSDIKAQLDNFTSTFKSMPSKAESYTVGKLRQATGTQTQKEANFNAQRTLLFNQIARKLGGEKGVLSDQDIKRIEASLPSLTDSYEQKQAKMKAVYDLLDIKSGKGTKSDPLGIR